MTTKTAREILDAAKPRQTTLSLCLAGPLEADWERLEAELADLTTVSGWRDKDAAERIAAEMESVRAAIVEATTTLTFRAMRPHDFEALCEEYKNDDGTTYDLGRLAFPLIKACLVDPEFSTSELTELLSVVNDGQRVQIFDAAWEVNRKASRVPFSERASLVMRARDSK